MVVNAGGVAVGIEIARRNIRQSLEQLTDDEIKSRIENAHKQIRKDDKKALYATALGITAGLAAPYTINPDGMDYTAPVLFGIFTVSTFYGIFKSFRGLGNLYIIDEGEYILKRKQNQVE